MFRGVAWMRSPVAQDEDRRTAMAAANDRDAQARPDGKRLFPALVGVSKAKWSTPRKRLALYNEYLGGSVGVVRAEHAVIFALGGLKIMEGG